MQCNPEVTKRQAFSRRLAILKVVELSCWIFGVCFVLFAGYSKAQQYVQANAAIEAFQQSSSSSQYSFVQTRANLGESMSNIDSPRLQTVVDYNWNDIDQSLWSQARKDEFRQLDGKGRPIALLRIDALGMLTPVFEGSTNTNLHRGAGWIEHTSYVDDHGNIGIAAHRDSFFRKLKDVEVGQHIVLETDMGERTFEVSSTQIVDPSHVEVLAQKGDSRITLVTCYPFYFVGSAPKRFIVTAKLIGSSPTEISQLH